MTGDGDENGDRTLNPSDIAEIVRFSKCEQFTDLQFRGHIDNQTEEYPVDRGKLTEPNIWASPVLSTLGEGYELDVYEELVDEAGRIRAWVDDSDAKARLSRAVEPDDDVELDLAHAPTADDEVIESDVVERLVGAIRDASDGFLDEPALLFQPTLFGEIGEYPVEGDADLVVVWPDDPADAGAHVRAYDIKAGDEKPHHQVQATLYAMLIEEMVGDTETDYTLSTGIIDGETPTDNFSPDAAPSFAYESRREDVRRMLEDDGFLDRVFSREDTPPHELGKAADESGFGEVYHVQSIEDRDIRLLGLSEAAQSAFRNRGLDTLEDVAELVPLPDDPRPYEEVPAVEPRHEETVRELNADTRVGERVQLIAQRAQVLLGRLNHSHTHARDEAARDGAWLQGSGKADLPEDDPPWDADFDNIEPGTLVRAYIDVQADFLNERVLMLNAAVECGQQDDPVTVTSLVDEVPDIDDGDFDAVEGELVEEFTTDLFAAMQDVARDSGVDETGFHLYFHTAGDRDRFVDALDRHDDSTAATALREVFDLRSAIHDGTDGVEQRMVSVLQSVMEDHYAFSEPGYDLPHARSHLKWIEPKFWTHERPVDDGTAEVNLLRSFRYQFATRVRQFVRDENGGLVFDPSAEEPEGRYPTLPRDESQLPLEYFWAAEGIETPHDDWIPETGDDDAAIPTDKYFECETVDGKTVRTHRKDIRALGERLVTALRDIERELDFCRRPLDDERIDKTALPLAPDDLRDRLGTARPEATLAAGARDYLDLENRAEVEELHTLRDQPVRQRVKTGRALPIQVDRIADDEEPHDLEASLAYDTLQFDNGETLFSASRIDDGDTVIASAVDYDRGEFIVDDDRWAIERAPLFRVHDIDRDDANPVKLRIEYDGGSSTDDPYEKWNLSPSLGEPAGEWEVRIDAGDTLVLDEDQMTLVRTHARQILGGVEGSPLYQTLEDVRRGVHSSDDLQTDAFDGDSVDAFLDGLDEAAEDDEELVAPNDRQRGLIEKVEPRISLLQGPPGTGKTTGALAPYLLSRAHAKMADHDQFCALVTAPTHTAIKEVLEDVADLHNRCQRHDVGDLDDLTMYRLKGSDPPQKYKVAGSVEYINYNDSTSFNRFVDSVWNRFVDDGQSTLGGGEASIVFATPHTMYRLARDICAADDQGVADVYADPPSLFDAVAIDEASMLTLPELFMATPFAAPDRSQTVIAGDHRQMPPVQQHDWQAEDRLATAETLPFLSALNYCRHLRGEEIERVERADYDVPESPKADIAFTKLRRTYRCHRTVTEFLRRWMYAKDGIDYTSEVDATLDVDSDAPDVLGPVFGEAPLVLLTHDDRSSRQRNRAEADLVGKIVNHLPNEPDDDAIGVVTPHNAQKAQLNQTDAIREANRSDDCGDVPVDTVERFQGGERETIIISATVSDPAYLDAESDFIMNPNRLNVALSRMKKKLVVVAPESLFEMIPGDTNAYEDAQIWKGLYQTAATGEPDSEIDVIFGEGNRTRFKAYAFDGD